MDARGRDFASPLRPPGLASEPNARGCARLVACSTRTRHRAAEWRVSRMHSVASQACARLDTQGGLHELGSARATNLRRKLPTHNGRASVGVPAHAARGARVRWGRRPRKRRARRSEVSRVRVNAGPAWDGGGMGGMEWADGGGRLSGTERLPECADASISAREERMGVGGCAPSLPSSRTPFSLELAPPDNPHEPSDKGLQMGRDVARDAAASCALYELVRRPSAWASPRTTFA
ncbi:hypothetical protein FB451DRAFT_1370986 [Mycena latifolia]|nr:hypothetical protein FB451DRAFT_1370986 [Mycena latifolia]